MEASEPMLRHGLTASTDPFLEFLAPGRFVAAGHLQGIHLPDR